MKKLLILFTFGCMFADTIEYRSSIFYSVLIKDIEFIGTNDGKVFYKDKKGILKSIPCQTVNSITNKSSKMIEFNCNINTITNKSNPSESADYNSSITSENSLIQSGTNLVEFSDKYNRGARLSTFGSGFAFSGMIFNKPPIFIAGLITYGVGKHWQFLSFRKVREAGEQLKKAGVKQEKDKNSNSNNK